MGVCQAEIRAHCCCNSYDCPCEGRAASCLKHHKSQLLVLTERLSLEGREA